MELLNELKDVKGYAPVIVGATAGLVGIGYVDQQIKSWVGAVAPGNDMIDLAARGGLTVAMIAMYLATEKAQGNVMMNDALNAFAISGSAVAAFSLVAKLLGWTSMTIGRAGPVRAGRPVNVVRKETLPTYSQVPTAETHVSAQTPIRKF